MKRFKVSELSKSFNLSTTALYRHIKRFQTRLEEHISKDGGVTLITEEGVEILREGISAITISSKEVAAADHSEAPPSISKELLTRQSEIQKAILAIAESFKGEISAVRQDMAKIAADNMVLTNQNQRLNEQNQQLIALMTNIREDNASWKKFLAYSETKPAAVSPAMVPAKKEPSFWQGFHQNVVEVQEWMRGVLAPFTEVFKGGN